MMVGGRVLALASLLVVFASRGVWTFSKAQGKSPLYPSKSIPSHPKPPVAPPSKSYFPILSQPSPPLPSPVKLQCDKTVPIFLPREIFTPQDEPANPAQNADSSCNFDSPDDALCSWAQDYSDDFDWSTTSGSTPTSDTGPSVDHTTGTAAGSYAFIDSGSKRGHGDTALLVSPNLDGSAKCLTFWYHRYGDDLGDLTVYIRSGSSDDFEALTISSASEDAWKKATLSLPSATSSAVPYQIVIGATVGSPGDSDIAIDDISFATGLCGAEPPFFVALNARLKAEHCHKKPATGCERFGEDGPFQAIADYVWNFCKRDLSSPAYLEDLILSYCKYHSNDDAVKMAYSCSTGCKLADHVNQVCHNMKLAPACPDDNFDLINGRCYRLVKMDVDWADGLVRCQAMGSELARLETEEESDALNELLLTGDNKVWIGLTDFVTEGEFNWLGSTDDVSNPLLFTDWEPMEPSGNGECVVFWVPRDDWEDEPCDEHHNFICEKSPTPILDHPAAAATT